jgi:hypothetical protein
LKPPSVLMITPSGRFVCDTRICLTISDWHPESWNPVWKVESIIMGLLSFMLSEEGGIGSMTTSEAERKKFAKASLDWNLKKNKAGRFEQIFDSHFVRLGLREGKVEEPPVLKKQASKGAKEEEKKGKEEEKKGTPAPAKAEAAPKRGAAKKEVIEPPKAQPAPAAPAQNKRGAKEEEKKQNKDNKA